MDTERFLIAQEGIFDDVIAQLNCGRKTSHWMWFIFPQLAGLGHSDMAQRYALKNADDARTYLRHPTLGARLITCSTIVAGLQGLSARAIFGDIDAMKFHSSMTLFDHVKEHGHSCFENCLQRYFDGQLDGGSLSLLGIIDNDFAKKM